MRVKDLIEFRAAMLDTVFAHARAEGFLELDTPEITLGTGACEEVPTVFRLDFLGRTQFLRQTAQLDLEVAVIRWGLPRVITRGRSFRAEARVDGRHLCEFQLIEAEARDWTLEDLIAHEQRLVRAVMETAIAHPALPAGRAEVLRRDLTTFRVISYEEAIGLLERQWGDDLTASDEAALTERFGIVSVIRYPREIKFFNMLNSRHNGRPTVECCDLLLPLAGETFGSSAREHDPTILRDKLYAGRMYRQLVDAGGDPQVFESYLALFDEAPVHRAGYGLGFDRLIQYLWGAEEVTSVIPFPVTAHYGSPEFAIAS
jgi:asparaginyl-tRNA synthetase